MRPDGTGEIHVHATSTLDATLTGTGSIVYSGRPAVTTHNTGTGSINGEQVLAGPAQSLALAPSN